MKPIYLLSITLLAFGGCKDHADHTVTITGVVCAHCVPVKTFPVACWKTDDGKVHRPNETMQANTHYYIFIDEKDCTEGPIIGSITQSSGNGGSNIVAVDGNVTITK